MILLHHFGDIQKWIFGTHQRINGRFVNYKVETLVRICHFTDIHNIVFHLFHPFFLLTSSHFFNNNCRNVIIGNVMITILIQTFLNCAVSTTDVQNRTILALRKTTLDYWLRLNSFYLQSAIGLKPLKAFPFLL